MVILWHFFFLHKVFFLLIEIFNMEENGATCQERDLCKRLVLGYSINILWILIYITNIFIRNPYSNLEICHERFYIMTTLFLKLLCCLLYCLLIKDSMWLEKETWWSLAILSGSSEYLEYCITVILVVWTPHKGSKSHFIFCNVFR